MIRMLPDQWRTRAAELEPYAPAVALAFRRAAEELEREIAGDQEPVSLAEGSRLGGYSADHLQRLVASGKLENIGRKNRPRIRRIDVPTKPGHRLPSDADGDHFPDRRRIVASVLTGDATT